LTSGMNRTRAVVMGRWAKFILYCRFDVSHLVTLIPMLLN
jgi:hypothetical protein